MNIIINKKTVAADEGENLLTVLQKNSIDISAPCGGNGICGNCKVIVNNKLSLACKTTILDGMNVETISKKPKIETKGGLISFPVDSIIKKVFVSLKNPTLDDNRDDITRVKDYFNIDFNISIDILRTLPIILRKNDFNITVVHDGKNIISIEGGDTSQHLYGFAVDIGTTTIVCHLVNLLNGKIVSTSAQMNAQSSFGADVISRINSDTKQLQTSIINQLNEMTSSLMTDIKSVYAMTIAGNSAMLHLLCGIDASSLALAPFCTVFLDLLNTAANELGLNFYSNARVFLLPSVSAYVGADITAAILSSGMTQKKELQLLIDIGTNGEMALGNCDGIVCCSTAAGPAFEGGSIKNGMAGTEGAIFSVDRNFRAKVIGGTSAKGICGSGLLDLVAHLLESKVIDETGFMDEDFIIENIAITPGDIRELQLAKSAIAAGINVLFKTLGVTEQDITSLYLAGGFGSALDPISAAKIGLFPNSLVEKAVSIGNAAGSGAVSALASQSAMNDIVDIAKKAKYIELSTTSMFQDEFIKNMMFE